MTKINNVLCEIQSRLVAPKGQRNTFGNYNYRSCEDILNALKGLLADHRATVTLSDEMLLVGNRIYVKATATLIVEGETVSVSAFAREPESRKGMDDAQVTGATSSYARKYALNGLFAIDDTKDADTQPPPERKPLQTVAPKPTMADRVGKAVAAYQSCKTSDELMTIAKKCEPLAAECDEANRVRLTEAYAQAMDCLNKAAT